MARTKRRGHDKGVKTPRMTHENFIKLFTLNAAIIAAQSKFIRDFQLKNKTDFKAGAMHPKKDQQTTLHRQGSTGRHTF